jgi:hypothetical protein
MLKINLTLCALEKNNENQGDQFKRLFLSDLLQLKIVICEKRNIPELVPKSYRNKIVFILFWLSNFCVLKDKSPPIRLLYKIQTI